MNHTEGRPMPTKKPKRPKPPEYVPPPPVLTRVPCLGPGAPACTGTVIRRDDEPGNRFCPACRVLRDARVRSYSPTAFAPSADAGID